MILATDGTSAATEILGVGGRRGRKQLSSHCYAPADGGAEERKSLTDFRLPIIALRLFVSGTDVALPAPQHRRGARPTLVNPGPRTNRPEECSPPVGCPG